MSQIFSNNTIIRFFNRGELEYSQQKDFLVDRISIATVVGQQNYTLPDYVKSIRRVTYLGNKCWPMDRQLFRTAFQNAPAISGSFWYIFNNVGVNQIKLYPAPAAAIPLVTNVWDTDIPNGVIVEFYRTADNVTFIVPAPLRRQLLKAYVGKMIFSIEGAGQNLKLAQYFDGIWQKRMGELNALIDDLIGIPRRLVVGTTKELDRYGLFNDPLLPINRYGISVDDEY